VRLFDVTVAPGTTYEYRIQIRMANPNFARTDVAAKSYAEGAELTSAWYPLPQTVTVPPEVRYYAVDQAKLDKEAPKPEKDKDGKEPPKPAPASVLGDKGAPSANETVLQMHRWVDFLDAQGQHDLPVGEWVIAERVLASRGELVGGRKKKVDLLYWRDRQDRFVLLGDSTPPPKAGEPAPAKPPAAKSVGVDVQFAAGDAGDWPILVDFMGGKVEYKRYHPKTDDAAPTEAGSVKDEAPVEVLLYSDGRLLLHDSAADAADKDRKARLEEMRSWVDKVRNAKSGKDSETPFGGKGSGGGQ
jgi:hypothetical protein